MRSTIKHGPKTRAVKLMHEAGTSVGILDAIAQASISVMNALVAAEVLKSAGFKPDAEPDACDFARKPNPDLTPGSVATLTPAELAQFSEFLRVDSVSVAPGWFEEVRSYVAPGQEKPPSMGSGKSTEVLQETSAQPPETPKSTGPTSPGLHRAQIAEIVRKAVASLAPESMWASALRMQPSLARFAKPLNEFPSSQKGGDL